jgi:MGT family glycosyltransferase
MTQPVVVFFPEGAYGPTNNCVGIGSILRSRGIRVVFVVEESFAGTLEANGFEEALMRLQPAPEVEEQPGQFWKDFIRDTAPEFQKATIEQLSSFMQPTWQALIDGSKYVNPRLEEIFDELAPDVIVEDNVVAFPAVVASGRPWVRIVSCNPLELKDPGLPPPYSGYPSNDANRWAEFRREYRRTHLEMWRDFNEFVTENGCPPLPELEFIHESSYLNMYVYPSEADYERTVPLGSMWNRIESSVRSTDRAFTLPEGLGSREGRLIYLSLGSLGSADVELMQRLIDTLARTPHSVVVSMGPQHELLRLADNMWGREFLPQPSILPQADVVITHGGNNTVTECLHFGRPMVVLPLFWDQYDNAQRMDELGFGIRLPTYEFEPEELVAAIDGLLTDREAAARLSAMSARLQADSGVTRAADLIERLATSRVRYEPGTSLPRTPNRRISEAGALRRSRRSKPRG